MSKWFWRTIFGLAVLYLIISGVSRHIHVKRLTHDLKYGNNSVQVKAARDLMVHNRLYDKVQEMPKAQRIKMMDVIEQVTGELGIKHCLELLKDKELTVRARVTKSLILLGKNHIKLFVPEMKNPDANVSAGAKDALVGIGPIVIPYVHPVVKEPDLRGPALDVLTRLKEPSVPVLVELLVKGDQDVRMGAADSLGKVGSKKATPALLKATRDIKAVRRIAISSLCTICDPRSEDLLVEVLSQNKDDGEIRARAARALSVIGGPRSISTLTGALGDWDLKVRTSVISGLQRIGPSAVKLVMAAMKNSGSQDVRRAGAAVLERIDCPESASALRGLTRDSDPTIRASAARGLGAQTSGGGADLLISMLYDKDGRVASTAEDALVSMGSRSVPALTAVLRSSSSDVVKYQASDALARIGSPAAPSLVAMLGTGGASSKWAAYALGRSHDPKGKQALERFSGASDPELAWIVKRGLNRL